MFGGNTKFFLPHCGLYVGKEEIKHWVHIFLYVHAVSEPISVLGPK
jgi:hypothetical protein